MKCRGLELEYICYVYPVSMQNQGSWELMWRNWPDPKVFMTNWAPGNWWKLPVPYIYVYIYMCLYLSEPFSWLRWGLTDRTCPCISSLGWILKNKVAPVSTSLIAMDRCQVYWIISISVGLQRINIFPPRIRVLGNYIRMPLYLILTSTVALTDVMCCLIHWQVACICILYLSLIST